MQPSLFYNYLDLISFRMNEVHKRARQITVEAISPVSCVIDNFSFDVLNYKFQYRVRK